MEGLPRPTASANLDAFRPLLPAEEVVLSRLASGGLDRLGDGARPDTDDPERAIRASFLRFLLLGGEEGIGHTKRASGSAGPGSRACSTSKAAR